MRTVFLCLIYMMFAVLPARAAAFVDESTLPAFMLNQNDPLFYSQGVLDTGSSSSLCGTVSVMNWLQWRSHYAYSKIQLVNFVQVIGEDLRKQNIDIKSGVTEFQLLEFLKIYNFYLEENTQYVLRNSSELKSTDLLSDRVQILMLRYSEVPKFTPGGPRRDSMSSLISGSHYALKVGADIENSELVLIDPENPEYLTRVKLKDLQITPVRKKDLSAFRFGVPLKWHISGVIEEHK